MQIDVFGIHFYILIRVTKTFDKLKMSDKTNNGLNLKQNLGKVFFYYKIRQSGVRLPDGRRLYTAPCCIRTN